MKYIEKILIYLSRKSCATLDEIVNDLNMKEDTVKVYLSRLAKERIITRRWLRTTEGKKMRLYCLNTTVLKELHVQ